MDDLASRVQDLPPQLYNLIYNDVFTPSTTTINLIDKTYKPPSTLQVDRQSRVIFAMAYYGKGTTIISEALFPGRVVDWLSSLNTRHLARLRKAKYLLRFDEETLKSRWSFAIKVLGGVEGVKQEFVHAHANDVAQLLKQKGLTPNISDLRVEAEARTFTTPRQYKVPSVIHTIQASMEDLANRVQGLPPELYNHIYYEVFTPTTPTIRIDEFYNPPLAMQVDHHSRSLFTERYYSEHAIIVADTIDWGLVLEWLKSLSSPHLAHLCGARYIVTADMVVQRSEMEAFKDAYTSGYAKGFATQLRTMRGVGVDWTSLRIEIEVEGEE
ncbi:hypothetical protein LTR37_008885 [Vermiconidia calcicola]|uniref:Uncharacterized protein n=1 Tax=Vermiconidia calcicola TaxID=1690605 RepID=A0ACC3N9D2_9PEZI|nr:hypothetical protein LTR37_008885 [Vermiconidia calcicola]